MWMEKSVHAVAAFLGIVYSGCFYVMLDKKQPLSRIRQILDTLEQPLVIADGEQGKEREKLNQAGDPERGFQVLDYEVLEKNKRIQMF